MTRMTRCDDFYDFTTFASTHTYTATIDHRPLLTRYNAQWRFDFIDPYHTEVDIRLHSVAL